MVFFSLPSPNNVCPENTLAARFITGDRRKINRTIDLGYRKVIALEHEIMALLKEDIQ